VEDQAITVTKEVLLKGLTRKPNTKGEDYFDVTIRRDESQFDEPIKCWDPAQLAHLEGKKAGTRHAFIFKRRKVKRDKPDDGAFWNYDWEIIGETELRSGTTTNGQTPGPRATGQPRQDPTGYSPPPDARSRPIERSAALKEAVIWCLGKNLELVEVADIADHFVRWLSEVPPPPEEGEYLPFSEEPGPVDSLGRPVAVGTVTLPESEREPRPQVQGDRPPPRHVGELLMRALTDFKMTRAETLNALGVSDPKKVTDLDDAWEKILAVGPSYRDNS
jgi:hypothetical protein